MNRVETAASTLFRQFRERVYHLVERPQTAWWLLGMSLVATVVATLGAWHQLRSEDQRRFLVRTERFKVTLQQELESYARLLSATRALWVLHPPSTRDEWRSYVESLDLESSFPHLRALGFIQRVPSNMLAGFAEQLRREASPGQNFIGRQINPPCGEDEHYLVRFIEPFGPNRLALGQEFCREPDHRESLHRACESGRMLWMDNHPFVQGSRPFGLVLLPVYSFGIQANDLVARRGNLLGLVYATFRLEDLLRRVSSQCHEEVEGELFAGESAAGASHKAPGPRSSGPGVTSPGAALQRMTPLEFAGSLWSLRLVPGAGFTRTSWFSAPGHIAAATLGLSISLLIFGVARSVAYARQRTLAWHKLALSQQELQQTLGELKASHQELRRAQFQLIQSAKMECIGTLAAGVAHEVKNPLQTILSGLDYLGIALPKPYRNIGMALNDMRDAVGRADCIVRELLELSRDTAFELTEADLNKVLERCLHLLNSELLATRTRIVCRLQPALPLVRVDTRKMEQVFLNLCMNALQAMSPGGRLVLRTRSGCIERGLEVNGGAALGLDPGEQLVIVEIQDSGPGISKDHLARIFDPFFTTKPPGKGTGLGLPIVKKIMELHGGVIDVRNAPEGGVIVTLAVRTWFTPSPRTPAMSTQV